MIAGIYSARFFIIKNRAGNSSQRQQAAGIAQRCPLSPYLCIIVQSVMFSDIDDRMYNLHIDVQEPTFLVCTDLLCADDTMLASSCPVKLQTLLDAVIDEGARYGLELNWGKTVAVRTNNNGVVRTPSGEPLKIVDQTVYLGGLLSVDVAARPELARRIGEAKVVFKSLHRCWSHANITRQRKTSHV